GPQPRVGRRPERRVRRGEGPRPVRQASAGRLRPARLTADVAGPIEVAGPGPIVLDGGLATELEARGHDLRDRLWSARLLVTDPGAIEDVHLAYFRAGARVAI